VRVAVPFSRRCLARGLIVSTTLADCRTFYTDFLAKVQNSIETELLPSAVAAAAAAERLLETPRAGADAAGPLQTQLSPRAGGSSAHASPFAGVEAEVLSRLHSVAAGTPVATPRRGSRHRPALLDSLPEALVGVAGGPSVPLTRLVSAKPSFAQPITELRLANRCAVTIIKGLCCPCCSTLMLLDTRANAFICLTAFVGLAYTHSSRGVVLQQRLMSPTLPHPFMKSSPHFYSSRAPPSPPLAAAAAVSGQRALRSLSAVCKQCCSCWCC
jgi:hypothetical protein